jgi:chitinase
MSSQSRAIVSVTVLLAALSAAGAQALDCSGIPAWNATTTYAAGAKITRAFVSGSSNPGTTNNVGTVGATYAYKNTNGGRWGDDPAAGTSWSVWGALMADGSTIAGSGQSASPCGAASTPTPTAPPRATATATSGATATATTGSGSCSGLPAFASCTAYALGVSVSYNGTKYTTIGTISSSRDCPPSSPYNPSSDNWWRNDGACSGSSPTATATRTPTATGPTATATRTTTPTVTPTTSGGGGGFPARFAAPYVATWNDPDQAALAATTRHKFWTCLL